jgi:hypothetical protein
MNKLLLPILGMAVLLFTPRIEGQDIRILTITTTNVDTHTIRTKDICLRNGMTNLVRRANCKNGKLQIRVQQIYQNGALLGMIVDDKVNGVVGISAEQNCAHSLDFQFTRDRVLQTVTVSTNGVLVDGFACTNEALFPLESSTLKKANEVGADLTELLNSKNVRTNPPGMFMQRVEKLVEKYGDT